MVLGNKTRVMREIPAEWDRLIKFAEALKFGEINVKIKNGIPYLIENAIQQIALDDPNFEQNIKVIPLL